MSKLDEYQTPIEFYKLLDNEFHFNLDPCTTKDNPLNTVLFYTKEKNGLYQDWSFYIKPLYCKFINNVFVNPPYSEIGLWIEKGYNESLKGSNIVFLIMVDTSSSYWHDYIFPFAKQIRYIRGRLGFILNRETKNNNRHASAVIIFSNNLTYKNKEVYYKKSINKFLNPSLSDSKIDKIVNSIMKKDQYILNIS